MAAPPVCGISLEPSNKWKVVHITTHNVNFPSYVFVQGSIFGVSSDFSYNENGLHPFTSFIFIQWCGFSFYQDTLTSSQVELWMELLVCHRQTHNLESDFHHAGLFWKWHLCSVTWWDSVRVVRTERTSQSRATVGRPPVDLGDDTFGNTVFLGTCVCFYTTGSTQQEKVFDCVHSSNWSCEQGFSLLKSGSTHGSPVEPEKHYQLPTTNDWLVCDCKQTRIDGTTATSHGCHKWSLQLLHSLK